MKKSFQIWRQQTIPARTGGIDGEKVISDQLKENYAKATGFFIVPFAANQKDLSDLTISLKIAGNEILPKGTDASIVSFNGNVALDKVVYDFSKDNIPARSSEIEMVLTNKGASLDVNLYVVLENE